MLYFHIPFCKQACHYCDFHFSTSLQYKDEMMQALEKEITLRADYLDNPIIHSIYFGGGTPSILKTDDIERLIERVGKHFKIADDAEITLEANPDDLNIEKVIALKQTNINRFSIGIQSFFEEDLRWMNRAHNAEEANTVIKRVQDAGFENITCDLIYGYPLLTNDKWYSNMQKLIDFGIPHISSYSMTVEKKTALDHFIKQGKTAPMDDSQSAEQMNMLIDTLTTNGFEHYEISNFAKPGNYARHNTNYWKGKHYLGIGPSAHSFNGKSRSWNIANNVKYIAGIANNTVLNETEELSPNDRINEYIMTSLRTMWGIDIQFFATVFGKQQLNHLLADAKPFVRLDQLQIEENSIKLTKKGKIIADHIIAELFQT